MRASFPPQTHRLIEEGVARVRDFQDRAYADLYVQRLAPVLAADQRADGAAGGYKLTSETARFLALWMSYEDIIRVADLKTRRARFERVRSEVGAKPEEPIVIVEYLKPGVEEICSILPRALARPVLAWAERTGRPLNFGMHLKTTTVSGYLLLRSLAWLRPLRRMTSRYGEEQARIERWLAAVVKAAEADGALALEIAECARLVKGYGDTHRRGWGNFERILATLAEGEPAPSPGDRAAAIRKARLAALADPEGKALAKEIGEAKPVVAG
ncbi:MAG: hypothetical protein M5U08_23430 [Burkholderiales bacterium]|nr:hypothetical protein [Burkholderiales bacterium]